MKGKTSTAQPLRSLLFGAVGLACTVVFFQGMRIFLLNYIYFDISLWHAAGWIAVTTLLLILIIVAPAVGLRLRRHEVYSALVLGAALFAWFKASFLSWDYGLFTGVDIDWNSYRTHASIDVAVLVLILSGSVLARRKLVHHSGTLVWFLFIAQSTGLVVLTPLADHSRRTDIFAKRTVQLLERKTEKLSRTSNVLILIIDTLQSDVVSELVTNEPGRQARLRGFTFFRDTAASSALTWVSVPNALTGTLFDNQVPYAQYLGSAYETPGSALNNLRASGYYVELVPWRRATPIPLKTTFLSNTVELGFEPNLQSLKSILATASFTVMPQFLQRRMHHYVLSTIWDVFDPGGGSNIEFIRNTDRLPVEFVDRPVAKVIHLRGPHIPLLGYGRHALNYADAARASAVDIPTSLPFTRDNYVRAAAVMLDAVIGYLAKLDRVGAYESSAIFIFGDHGAGRQGLRFHAPVDWPVAGRSISSYMQSGAAAALLVKAPGANRPFRISDTPTALSDVACTINTSIVGRSGGQCHSLFAERPVSQRERIFIEFRDARFDTNGYFSPMTEYAIASPMWQVASWRPTGRTLLPGAISKARPEP